MIIDIGNPTHCLRDCPVCDCEREVCKADPLARHVDWTTDTVPDWCPGKDMVVKKVKDAVEMLLTEAATGWLALIPAASSPSKLRRELPEEERKRIMAIIDQIAAEREKTK